MNGWIIFALILLVLFALTLIRLGAEVTYGEEGLRLRVRAGKIWITLLPRKPKKPKKPSTEKSGEAEKGSGSQEQSKKNEPKSAKDKTNEEEKPDEEKPKTEEQNPPQRGGLPIPLTELISLGIDAAGRFLARLQIDNMEVEYLIGGRSDPAGASILYGSLYAGGGAIVPALENTFYRIRHREIRAWIDFDSDQSLIWLQLALSIRVGQLLSIGIAVAIRFLKAYFAKKKADKQTQEGR